MYVVCMSHSFDTKSIHTTSLEHSSPAVSVHELECMTRAHFSRGPVHVLRWKDYRIERYLAAFVRNLETPISPSPDSIFLFYGDFQGWSHIFRSST